MQNFLSLFSPRYPTVLTYMLQSSEYQVLPYIRWLHRTKNFNAVMQRRQLDATKAARLLLWALRLGMTLQVVIGLALIYLGITSKVVGGVYFGCAVLVIYPLLWAYLVTVPLLIGKYFIVQPRERELVQRAEKIFAAHPGVKIAVAGSYGKTSMKELLLTILREGKKVAATPGNKNVSVSHATFAARLQGDEEVLVIEYGEGAPGDIARFAKLTDPTHAVITGLAPAHLDQYKTLQAAGEDIFSLANYVDHQQFFVADDSMAIKPFLKADYQLFDVHQALGWNITHVKTAISGTDLTLTKAKKSLKLHTGLIGQHQATFVAFAAVLGLELGLSERQVQAGVAQTVPFEHRLQPYQLSGAWIIDDTYNGNLEGIRAGTRLLKDLTAKRKIYVTPGLVEQGMESERVHIEVGELIAAAKPEIVVLMKNSVTSFIQAGLTKAGFSGEVRVEDNPLEFYTNLTHFVASGDVVLMQNDWTDNYA